MSTLTAPEPPAPAGVPAASPARRALMLLGVVAAGWAVTAVAHLAGAAAVIPALFVVALVGLQRGLPGWLDRCTVAIGQLFGAVCAGGLLFSVWPWHLHPVALTGTGWTALVALAAAGRRRWRAPRRPRAADLAVLAATAAVAGLSVLPFAVRDLGARLGLIGVGEDFARHFLLYDLIGEVGGYAFLHPAAAAPFLPDHLAVGIRNYPQGTHFAYAVLERFIGSAGAGAAPLARLDTMIWLYVATWIFLVLAVLWSLRRVAGPGAAGPRLLAVLALAAAWLYFGDPVGVFLRGYPNELVGLALAAMLTAVVVRPLTHRADQLATVALLTVGVSFSYHLFLPYAAAVAAAWAWRAKLWRRPAAMAAALALSPAAAVTPLLNLQATSAGHLASSGTALVTDRPATLVLLALAAGGLLARGGLRSPARRTAVLALAALVAVLAGLGGFQLLTVGHTVYYFDKLMHLAIVVGIVLLAGLVRVLPRGPAVRSAAAGPATHGARSPSAGPAGGGARLPAAVRLAVPLAVVAPLIGLLVAAGGARHTRPGSYGLRLVTGVERGSPGGGHDALFMARRHPDGGGAVDVDLMSTPYRNWYGTLYASAVQRNYRYGHEWYGFLSPIGRPKTMADLTEMVRSSPVPVRFYVYNPRASMLVTDPDRPERQWTRPGADSAAFGGPGAPGNIEAAEDLARRYPDKVEVVYAVPPDR